MPDLPIMLRLKDRPCLIVGAGAVALRRTHTLLETQAQVTVLAPQILPEFHSLPVRLIHRSYQPGDLAGYFLTIVATNHPSVNDAVAREAQSQRVLINRTDDATQTDFSIPAHGRQGPVTIAVHTDGISASAAVAIRRELLQALPPDWPKLLDIVAPYRARIQQQFAANPPLRRSRLQALAGPQALSILQNQGPPALIQYCESLLSPTPLSPEP